MVSSIAYVLYSMSRTFESMGDSNTSAVLAMTGLVLGLTLVFLSGFWGTARGFIMPKLPEMIRSKVP
jgi:hypothetical protein